MGKYYLKTEQETVYIGEYTGKFVFSSSKFDSAKDWFKYIRESGGVILDENNNTHQYVYFYLMVIELMPKNHNTKYIVDKEGFLFSDLI